MNKCPDGYKRCSKCGECKPRTVEYFSRKKHASSGLRSECKNCQKLSAQVYYQNNREAVLARNADYFERNPDKKREYARRWKAKNPERVRAMCAAYHQTHKAQIRARKARWREEHREELRAYRYERRDHFNALRRQSRRRNLEADTARSRRRRTLRASLPHEFTKTDWARALNYFGNCCAVCGRREDARAIIAADHWIPLSSPDCPGTVPTNIVPLCHYRQGVLSDTPCCNNVKNNKDPVEWLRRTFGEQEAAEILARIEAYFAWVREQK